MRIASSQLPPAHHSDDKIFATADAVVMLDGATAFTPVPVSPSTYAATLGHSVVGQLERAPHLDLRAILAAAIENTAQQLGLSPGRSPSSTVTILRRRHDHLEILVLGDNLVVVPGATITDDRIDGLDLVQRRQYRVRLAAGSGFDNTHRDLLRALQVQQAARSNRTGGYWIAEAEPKAARHAVLRCFDIDDVPWAVLVTDGAYTPLQHLGYADWSTLADLTSDGLQALLERCYSWEANDDPDARDLPRAKCHDDKSIAVIRFA